MILFACEALFAQGKIIKIALIALHKEHSDDFNIDCPDPACCVLVRKLETILAELDSLLHPSANNSP